MNRRILIAVLATLLTVPALVAAQSEGPRITIEPAPRNGSSPPALLPPAADPKTPASDPKTPAGKANAPALPAEIIPPVKVEPKPAVPVEESPFDPRPYNQRWLRHRAPVVDDAAQPAPYLIAPVSNELVWVVPEWIIWKTTGQHVPPLVTSSSAGAGQADSGVIGVGDTRVLFGNESQLKSFRSGIRVRAGFWLDPTQTLAIEGSMFYLGQKSRGATFDTSGETISLARPYFDASTGLASSEVVAFATANSDGTFSSTVSGAIITRTTTDFWGADINLRRYLLATDTIRIDGLLGFRYQRLRDTLETKSRSEINSDSAIGDLTSGSVLQVQDLFHTTSNFYGGQLGFATEWRANRWYVGMTGKLALGIVQHEVRINGLTTITDSDGETTQVTTGGLLAQNTNIGRHRSSRFSVIPEIGMNLGYQLTSNIRIFAGYSLLYWTNVVRPGDQIDLTVNSTQLQRSTTTTATLSGEARPGFGAAFRESGFWAHGANVGLEFRW